jgi:hypothetical protein
MGARWQCEILHPFVPNKVPDVTDLMRSSLPTESNQRAAPKKRRKTGILFAGDATSVYHGRLKARVSHELL